MSSKPSTPARPLVLIEEAGELCLHGFTRIDRRSRPAVVFVHGFSGNWTTAWSSFPELIIGDPNLIEYDVFAVGYRTGWFGGDTVEQVSRQIRGLLDRNLGRRRIVLIAHSLGGLVSMQCILDSLNQMNENRVQFQGLLMYGTPTQGVEFLRLAKYVKFAAILKLPMLGKIIGLFLDRNAQIKALSPESQLLDRLQNGWAARIINGGHQDIEPARRTWLQVGVVTGTKDFVVSEYSAKSFYGDIDWNPLPFGHVELVKPASRNDSRYVIAKNFLQQCARIRYPEILFRLRQLSDAILETRGATLIRDWEYSVEIGGEGGSLATDLKEAGYQECKIKQCEYITVLSKTKLSIGITFDRIASAKAWDKEPEYVHQITAVETDSADKSRLKKGFDRILSAHGPEEAWSILFPAFVLSVRGLEAGDKPIDFTEPTDVELIDGGGLLGYFDLPARCNLLGSEVSLAFGYTSAVPKSLTAFRLFFKKLTLGCNVTLSVLGKLDYFVIPTRATQEPKWDMQSEEYEDVHQMKITTDQLVLPETSLVTRWRRSP